MPTRAADEAEFINKRMKELERERQERIGATDLEPAEDDPEIEITASNLQPARIPAWYMGIQTIAVGTARTNDDLTISVWDGQNWISEEQAQDRGITII